MVKYVTTERAEKSEPNMKPYLVKIYVDHGYFQYDVKTSEQALAHGQKIMQSGVYRRETENGMEFHKPYKVKIVGPGLSSEYQDVFKRT